MNNKWFRKLIFISTLSVCSITTWGASKLDLQGELKLIAGETKWEDSYNAPSFKITLTDAYKKVGKTEKFILKLDGATWVDPTGAYLPLYNLKGVEPVNIALMSRSETEIQINLDIPSYTKEGDEISFCVPLLVRTLNDMPSVSVVSTSDTQIMTEEKLTFAATSKYKVNWKVEEVPTLLKEGNMASILLTEVRPNALSGKELVFKLKLQNKNFAFKEPTYLSKKEHQDTIDYIIDYNKYLTYGGAFKNNKEDIKLKMYKNTAQEIELTITANGYNEVGTLLLHDLPIINKNTTPIEEDLLITIEGEELVTPKKDIVVAHILPKTQTELEAEEELKEEAEKEQVEEQKKNSVTFTIGEKNYYVDGDPYQMDVSPYLMNPGYTMIPIRYVALAFGVDDKDISYGHGTAFIRYGDKNIELTVNVSQARVNGAAIKMQAPPVVKDGRIYIPIGEIAKLLGIQKQWNPTTQTAIFMK